jgi:hypothetical protein
MQSLCWRALAKVCNLKDFGPVQQGRYLTAKVIAAYIATSSNWILVGDATEQSTLDSAKEYAEEGRAILAVEADNPSGQVALALPKSHTTANRLNSGEEKRRSVKRSHRLSGHHRIAENAELFDFDFDDIAGLQKNWRCAENAHTLRGAGCDNVAGLEGDAFGDELDEFGDAKDHFGGVGVLQGSAVDACGDSEGVRIRDFVARGEMRTDRAEGVARFAADPLLIGELPSAGGDVVEGHVAEDVLERVGGTNRFPFAADDDGELSFVIDLWVGAGNDDGIIGAADAGGKFGEEDGSGRQGLGASFDGMVAIIEADGDDFSRPGNGGAKSDLRKWLHGGLGRLRQELLGGRQGRFTCG